jgi:hypothetical protein
MTDTTDSKAPPTPNPMNDGVNPYPRPETGKNWPLIDATRSFIASIPNYELDPYRAIEAAPPGNAWKQGEWRCETGMCFAGWGAALAGAKFPYAADAFGMMYPSAGSTPVASRQAVIEDADGNTWHIRDYAAHVMGLTDREATRLFRAGNETLDLIDEVIEDIRSTDDE